MILRWWSLSATIMFKGVGCRSNVVIPATLLNACNDDDDVMPGIIIRSSMPMRVVIAGDVTLSHLLRHH